MARSTWQIPNQNIAKVRLKGKLVNHGGCLGASVTSISGSNLVSSGCIDVANIDNWTGRALALIGRQSGSCPFLSYPITAFDASTGTFALSQRDAVLDIGCGGGRTVQRLAKMADLGKVHGVDYAEASVAASRGFNRAAVESGRVEIQRATVSRLPFPNDMFDLVTAVETHYYWPDRPGDMREIYRVLKPGGSVLIIAEVYRGRRLNLLYQLAMKLIGGAYLSPDDHRDLFVKAGYADAQVFLEPAKGWICATGRKPCINGSPAPGSRTPSQ